MGFGLESSDLPPAGPSPPAQPRPRPGPPSYSSKPSASPPLDYWAPGQFYWSLWMVLNEEMTQVMTTYGLGQRGV